MTNITDKIHVVAPNAYDLGLYEQGFSDCIILTHDNRIMLQYRPPFWRTSPEFITAFGGHIEDDETYTQAVIRELNEETGAQIKEQDLVLLGAVTEDITAHKDIVFVHFWHDKDNTVTGCYEAEMRSYKNIEEILATENKIMDYLLWALDTCRKKKLLP